MVCSGREIASAHKTSATTFFMNTLVLLTMIVMGSEREIPNVTLALYTYAEHYDGYLDY